EAVQHARDGKLFFISTLIVQEFATRRRLHDLRFLEDSLIADVAPPSHLRALRAYAQKPLSKEEGVFSKDSLARFQAAETNVKVLGDAGITIAAGTDAPYPGDFQGEGIHHELELLVESGLTPLEAITAATRNAAMILGAEKEWGTLEAGKL